MTKYSIPKPIHSILQSLSEAGFEAYIVGGCVRDLLLERNPKDWDVTTDALPEQIQTLFPDSFYENEFGTVGVKVLPFLSTGDPTREHDIVEVTTYRTEADYSDNRHPDTVRFTRSLTEDLKRRDFTMNAIALGLPGEIIDPFGGQEDIKNNIIRAVGDPMERFEEDALRLMRAIRFWSELRIATPLAAAEPLFDIMAPNGKPQPIDIHQNANWKIEESTYLAVKSTAPRLKHVSWERIRDEFSKIILSPSPAEGIHLLTLTHLLDHILPELYEGLGMDQNLHHIYTVYEHNLRALKTCPSPKLSVRLAALLHDVGKPRTKRGDGHHSTFYNHDHVGAKMTRPVLSRLRFPAKIIDHATLLVDNHLFYYNVGEVTEASVRRLIARVGIENMDDLMAVRIGDRLGSGTPKAKPYRLRHLEYMIEKVSRDAVSVKMLKIGGNNLMSTLNVAPGPKIGAILDVLLSEVIEDSAKNTQEQLLARADSLKDEDLEHLRALAKGIIQNERLAEDQNIKKKHWVQ